MQATSDALYNYAKAHLFFCLAFPSSNSFCFRDLVLVSKNEVADGLQGFCHQRVLGLGLT